MADAKHVNMLLQTLERQYNRYLTANELPDHPIVKLGFITMMVAYTEREGLRDPSDQEMFMNCLRHEMSRLTDLIAETDKS